MTDLAATIADASDSGAVLRSGVLTAIVGTSVTVDIGGGQLVDMPYLGTYLPVLADQVSILQQGSVSLVLGAPAAMPTDNAITNPSFELDPPGSTSITGWTAYQDPASIGSASAKVDLATGWGPKDGTQWLEINHGSAGDSYLYVLSDPIAVNAGERWSAVGHAVSTFESGADEPLLSLYLAFFADEAAVYPGGLVSQERLQLISGPTGPWWIPVRAVAGAGTVVPDGCVTMRVLLRNDTFGGAVFWDKIIARRLPG